MKSTPGAASSWQNWCVKAPGAAARHAHCPKKTRKGGKRKVKNGGAIRQFGLHPQSVILDVHDRPTDPSPDHLSTRRGFGHGRPEGAELSGAELSCSCVLGETARPVRQSHRTLHHHHDAML